MLQRLWNQRPHSVRHTTMILQYLEPSASHIWTLPNNSYLKSICQSQSFMIAYIVYSRVSIAFSMVWFRLKRRPRLLTHTCFVQFGVLKEDQWTHNEGHENFMYFINFSLCYLVSKRVTVIIFVTKFCWSRDISVRLGILRDRCRHKESPHCLCCRNGTLSSMMGGLNCCAFSVITMTSYWARWRLKSPASRLFIAYSGADQRKTSSASLAFVRGIHRSPVNSPHKWPVTRKMFPFDDVIIVNEWHHTHIFWKQFSMLSTKLINPRPCWDHGHHVNILDDAVINNETVIRMVL